ncbi:MAG TPA: amidohydrolase family protein [Candidatus Dormibacteraeota bacterium]|nr:amidohydrolase family protein [Candidatus Dormibacteraeota bacterium]
MRIIAVEEHYVSRRADPGSGLRPASLPDGVEGKLLEVGAARIADMDAAGIELQVLSLSAPGAQALDAAVAVPFAREENDRLAELVALHPDRFAAFAALPTADPAAAADELERAVRQLGFKGAMVCGHTHGRFLDDSAFWPILERAEGLGVPIYLHPAPPPKAVAEAYYGGLPPAVGAALATAAWGWHVETGLHLLRMILTGVFDRFPRLQVMVGHLGEALPFMLGRTATVLPPAVTRLQRSLPEYVRENVHITTSGFFSIPPFLNALLEVGVDRLIFAVDYPFSTNQEARAFLEAMPVSPADKERIARGNAIRLLRL